MFNDVELASLNHRGNHDLPEVKSVYEVSIGLDRVYLSILSNYLNTHNLSKGALELGVVYSKDYKDLKNLQTLLPFIKDYGVLVYEKSYKQSLLQLTYM